MKLAVCGMVLVLAVAVTGQDAKDKDPTFPEARFDKAVDYTVADRPVQDVINDIAQKFDLEIVAQLHPDQLATKPKLDEKNVTLRKLLVDFAKQAGGIWKREGEFVILQPSPKKFAAAPHLGPGGMAIDKEQLKSFIGSFTQDQKALHQQQGYLNWSDLTPDQQSFLKSMNPKWGDDGNHMAMKFRSPEFGDLTIKSGGDQ